MCYGLDVLRTQAREARHLDVRGQAVLRVLFRCILSRGPTHSMSFPLLTQRISGIVPVPALCTPRPSRLPKLSPLSPSPFTPHHQATSLTRHVAVPLLTRSGHIIKATERRGTVNHVHQTCRRPQRRVPVTRR